MTPDLFAPFYEAVHGHPPFPWQERLAETVAAQGWPAVLSLPTAAGKTAAIDIAVFTLALQARMPLKDRTAPLRTFFVIDRRLVVDQASAHAHRLRRALSEPPTDVVRQVAEALLRFGGEPLRVSSFRGGLYRDETWTHSPAQPTVCVSTVDQVGSRLLFRGYGLSEFARPVHAALVGNDALFLVDEAHLSRPFLATLHTVKEYRTPTWSPCEAMGPFQVVEMSATPQTEGVPFTLAKEDHKNAELRRRLTTPKPAKLVEAARFEHEAAALAVAACVGPVKVVGIVVNRVASARSIYEQLPGQAFEDKVLLTGRVRPWDRDAVIERVLDRVRAGRERKADDRPLFVVATMTVEVGADLDFDHLVTEAAPLPSLRQRFGRLDRLGRFGKASATIVLRPADGPDPVYGEDLYQAWQWMADRAKENGGVIDFGISSLDKLSSASGNKPPSVTMKYCPALLPAHMDALSQTSPAPEPSPDVAPFLHGLEALEAADVQLVWRADLKTGREDTWQETVAVLAPRSREALPLPVSSARAWLSSADPIDVADIEGIASPISRRSQGGRPVLRWCGPDSERTGVVEPREVRPGDTLVMPAEYGGADTFGWHPESKVPVEDIGDLCLNDLADAAPRNGPGRLVCLRLHDRFLDSVGADGVKSRVRRLQGLLQEGEETGDAVEEVLAMLAAGLSPGTLTSAVADAMARSRIRSYVYPGGVVLTTRVTPGFFQTRDRADVAVPDDSTDDDETSAVRSGLLPPRAVSLDSHSEGVARWCKSFAAKLGVEATLSEVVFRAAKLHDLGKADPRFQFLLYGDEPGETMLAKSGREVSAEQLRRIRLRAGLPKGFRHEFMSVALLKSHEEDLLQGLSSEHRRLVLYLVGSHHGRGRPFVPVVFEDSTQESVNLRWDGTSLCASPDHRLARLDSGWVDDFWQFIRRFGYWGLPFLEALLRLADGARSAEEQNQGSGDE